jgi:hypothetical protein
MRSTDYDVVGRGALGLHAEPGGGVRLRVEVEDEHALAVARERGAQVDGGRRLADAALLVGERDDRAQGQLLAAAGAPDVSRETSRLVRAGPPARPALA